MVDTPASPVESPVLSRDTIIRFTLLVADLDREIELFTKHLDFQLAAIKHFEGEDLEQLYAVPGLEIRLAILNLGRQQISLIHYLRSPGQTYPTNSRSNDLWFQHLAIVVRDMDQAYERLRAADIVPVSAAPQTIPDWNKAAAGVKAFYFRDKEGHPLELIYFPPDKGRAAWHQPGNDLFLGIDHSAFAVSDTDRSLHFYRDLLGLKVVGESLNYGETQEKLSSVPGARVHITSLRHDDNNAPGLEFLHYLAPNDGQMIPATRRNNDHAYGHAVVFCTDLPSVVKKLRAAQAKFISPDIVRLQDKDSAYSSGCMVRDPDGHDVLLVSH